MGVLGLWQLLNPTAKNIKIEGLEGKIIAIDISIWLHQASKGSSNRNAHLIVLFNRICKLLYYKIKPIFVFDGPDVPALKRRVLKERQKRRDAANNKNKELELELQKNFLETYALNQLLGQKTNDIDLDTLKLTKNLEDKDDYDMFKLNDISEKELKMIYEKSNDDNLDESIEIIDYPNINEIDKEVFDSLPIDIQMELLTDYKEKLKVNKGLRLNNFPEKSEEFSKYQMEMLLHKGDISKKLNGLKQTIKNSIANEFDLPFSNIIHEKIASEDDREILLITKTTDKFTTFQNMLQSKYGHKNVEEVSLTQNKKNEISVDNESLLKQIHRNKYDDKSNESNENDIIIKNDDIEIDEKNSEPILETNNLVKKITEKIDNLIKNQIDIEQNSDVPCIALSPKKKDEAEKESPKMYRESNILEISNLKRPHDESQQIRNLDVSGPKILKLNTETAIGKESKVADSETDDDDDDDLVEIIIPQVQIQESEKKLDNNSLDEIILLDEPEPTTSQSSNKNNRIESDLKELVDNENINLDDYHEYLKNKKKNLLKEKVHESKLSNSIENYMIEDTTFLLQLFGLPYINSPGEAEAQCAYLDLTNQTNGSITEDSDIWLFGANNVYKNFFNPNQYIEHYTNSFIQSQLGLNRESLINIALLVGSDYTTGVENVGIVKAMEILNEFNGDGFEKLENFKIWHDEAKKSNKEKLNKLRSSLKKLNLSNDFPSKIVYDAYKNPNIDKKVEKFNWGFPDLDSIRKFLMSKLSWNVKKIDDSLLPIIKRLNETKIQKTIDVYFSHETVLNFSKQSKRMKNAIKSFQNKTNAASTSIKDTNQKEDNDVELLNLSENDDDDNKQDKNVTIENTKVKNIFKIDNLNTKQRKKKVTKKK